MRRRAVLAALGMVALPGCAGVGPSERFHAFREHLSTADVRVKRLAADARRWILEYFPAAGRDGALAELPDIARAYAATVPPSGGHEELKCLPFDERTRRIAIYRIEADWARTFAAGTTSEEAYLERVHATLER